MENCLNQIKSIFSESNKTKLAIIGKGASLAEIDLLSLSEDYFIIALNDAEILIESDITIFYKPSSFSLIAKNGFKSKYYIAPNGFSIPVDKHISADYHSFDQEGIERIFTYFSSKDFYILDFTLISAIKCSLVFQEVKGGPLDVVFLGFDFYMNSVADGDLHGLEYRNAHLRTQESLFL